ncbi:MAG: sensor histidine kinase [Synechococcus sp.]
MDVSLLNDRRQAVVFGGQSTCDEEYSHHPNVVSRRDRRNVAVDNFAVNNVAENNIAINNIAIKKTSTIAYSSDSPCAPTENVSSVCHRQALELSDQLAALGVRIVFYDAQRGRWQWADGFRAEGFKQLMAAVRSPVRCEQLSGTRLHPNLVLLSPANRSQPDSGQSVSQRTEAYVYACFLNHAVDGDEHLLIATECPLTPSQQKSVNQRVHLLRDYLEAARSHSQEQAVEVEQRLRKVQHQLRNPLAAIELFADTLLLQLPAGNLRKQAEAIQATIRDMDKRLSLFQTSPETQSERTLCDLRAIALDAIAGLQHHWRVKRLCITVPDETQQVWVNRSQIQQVFENLLNNAIHFSPYGAAITCDWTQLHHNISVKITDFGPGLSSEDLKSAFLPHYSRRPGGHGLGLAIARGFIREHGGDIGCQSLSEGGAQFCFTINKPSVIH